MGNLSVNERLKIVSELINRRNDIRSSLEFYRNILQIQQEIDKNPAKGTRQNLSAQLAISILQEKSLNTKQPSIHFIDSSIFDSNLLLSLLKKILKIFIEKNPSNDGLTKFLHLVESKRIGITKLVEALLQEDVNIIRKYADEMSLQPALLLHVVSILIQPFFEEIARKIDSSFSDKWWQTFCPVCGRTPIVARVRSSKRYLVCAFCGAEYLSDLFVCVNCGNRDPYALKYSVSETTPEFQIDFCTKCNHYVKVINEEKLREPIPRGLEDILTLNLDLVAKNAGLVRD